MALTLRGKGEITLAENWQHATGSTWPMFVLSFGKYVVHGGWAFTNEAETQGGVTIQVFDASGTPRRTAREHVDMAAYEGSPYGWHMVATRIDNQRGVVAWNGRLSASGQPAWMMAFRVVDGALTLGTPVRIVPANGQISPQNGTFGPSGRLHYSSVLENALFGLEDGRAVYVGQFSDDEIQRYAGAAIRIDGLTPELPTWFALDDGYGLYSARNGGINGTASKGSQTFIRWSRRILGNEARHRHFIGKVDWDSPSPAMEIKDLYGEYPGVGSSQVGLEVVGDSLAFTHYPVPPDDIMGEHQHWFQPLDLAQPITKFPNPDSTWYSRNGNSYMSQYPPAVTPSGEWYASWWDDPSRVDRKWHLSRFRRTEQGVERVGDVVLPYDDPTDVPGVTYWFNGHGWFLLDDGSVAVISDYEVQERPWPVREFLSIYGDPKPPLNVRKGPGRQGARFDSGRV